MKPFQVQVDVFKPGGKWYAHHLESEPVFLKLEHRRIDGWRLSELISVNHPDTHYLSPVPGGFFPGYYFVINVCYPDDRADFCNFLLDRTNDR